MAFDSNISLQSLFKQTDFTGSTVIAAVSGGSDSLALLFLLKEYLEFHHKQIRLVAVTVDHQLRAESKKEAQQVGDICKHHNIEHHIIGWNDKKPTSNLSQEARFARYNLLCHIAKQLGSSVIMTGHTLDDQAETYEMRLQRSSKRGLAAMAREALLQDRFKLIRPLLSCRRQELRNYLTHKNMAWIDDPSNKNTAYERVRIRQNMTDAMIENANLKIQAARHMRQMQAKEVTHLIETINPCLKKDFLEFLPLTKEILTHQYLGFTLGVFAAIMGGAPYMPTSKQLEKLIAFAKIPQDTFSRMTLSGAVIEKGKYQWKIWRENRDIAAQKIDAFEKTIWDGRFLIENNTNTNLVVEPATFELLKILEKNQSEEQEKMHYASLVASPIIKQKQQFDAPVIIGHMTNIPNVNICRIMKPFQWIMSGDDFVMIDKLRPIFDQKYTFTEKK